MASSHTNENTTQCKTCQCGRDPKSSESSDKQPQKCPNCQILKSGPLFLSSKGIGWTQWKKRWFVLTHTSLVFYRSDPNSPSQKGSDANPSLGTIDLNNTGSVVLKADKKLLTIFFPDGNDDRTYTLKGETLEELQEWKSALENALAQAPSEAVPMGQNGIVRNEIADSVETSFEQWRDRKPVNSMVVGRPVLLALEEIDGSPSFLEKALRFIEDYGIKVEGILRQSADVEEVERRVREYEQGKKEFSSDEDAHVIGDCIKHILRELPSSPVPASCCTALVEAYKIDRGNRINAIRDATYETFPEPNLRLLQRILKMMKLVASHRSDNLMSLSALAACMAPLLLHPLLAGDCEFEDNFNMGGDGSLQLLKAAAAANHAQAIVMIMLEEYERIFDDESLSSESYTESEDDIEDDESTDNDILEDDGYHDAHNGLDAGSEDDLDHSSREMVSGGSSYVGSDISDDEEEDRSSGFSSPGDLEDVETPDTPSSTLGATALVQYIGQKTSSTNISLTRGNGAQKKGIPQNENSDSAHSSRNQANDSVRNIHVIPMQKSRTLHGGPVTFRNKSHEETTSMRRPTKWGRTPARKNLSMESIDYSTDDENAIRRLETTKTDLETKVTKEVQGNAILQESLEKRKQVLHERRLALEKDVEILQAQLQKERDLKASLEAAQMHMQPGNVPITSAMDSKTRVDLEEINLAEADIINLKQEATELHGQLSHHLQPGYALLCTSCKQRLDKQGKEREKIVDRALLHQNEMPSTNDRNSSSVPFENARAQKEDLPSSPNRLNSQKITRQTSPIRASGYRGSASTEESSTIKSTILPRKLSNTDEIVSSPADGADMVTKSQTSLSSPKGQHRKKKLSATNKNKLLPLESDSISSNEVPAAPNNSSSRGENSISGLEHENRRLQAKDSCPTKDRKLSQKPLQGDEAFPVTSDSSTKKSTSKGENPKFGADVDTEYRDAENRNLPTLADAQPSQKLPRPTTTNQSRMKSNDTSSTEGPVTLTRNFASKKSSFMTEDVKQEPHDSPSMSNRQQSQRHQSSTTGVKDDTALVGCDAASKKSFGSEEPQDSSSTQKRELSQKHQSSVSGVKDDTTLLGRNAASKKSSRSEEPQDSPSITNGQLSQKHKSGIGVKDDTALVGRNVSSKKSSRSKEPQDSPSITNKQPSQMHQAGAATGVKDDTTLVARATSSKKSSKSEDQVGTTGDKDDEGLVARPASSKKSSKSEDQKGTSVKDDPALVGHPASSKKSSKSEEKTDTTGVKDDPVLVGHPVSSKKSSKSFKSEDLTRISGVKDDTTLVGRAALPKKSSNSEDQTCISGVKDDTALVGRVALPKKSSKSEDQTCISGVKDDTALVGRPTLPKKSSKSEDRIGTSGVKDDTAGVGRAALPKKSSKSEDQTCISGVKDDTALVGRPAASKKSSKSEERRLQLANEVQNLDAKRTSGPEHTPRTNSR